MHAAQWIPEGTPGAGNFLYFNNMQFTISNALVQEFTPEQLIDGSFPDPPCDTCAYLPEKDQIVWEWADPCVTNVVPFFGNAQRLENGNTLVVSGTPGDTTQFKGDNLHIYEVIPDISSPDPFAWYLSDPMAWF